jgi:release factor glutamine methyltransferase
MLTAALRMAASWRHRLVGTLRTTRIARVAGRDWVVLPEVFDPGLFLTGPILADAVRDEVRPPQTWLDLGCGTGLAGVLAALGGARATAVDIDPRACRNAAVNARLHGVDLEVVHGDWLAPLGGRRFDRVAFNPPFFRGDPDSPRDGAWRQPDLVERIPDLLDRSVAHDGAAVLVLSDLGACPAMRRALEPGWTFRALARRRWLGETLTAWRLARRE